MPTPFNERRPSGAEIMAWHALTAYYAQKLNTERGFDWRNFKDAAEMALTTWNAVLEKAPFAGIELGNCLRRDRDYLNILAKRKEVKNAQKTQALA